MDSRVGSSTPSTEAAPDARPGIARACEWCRHHKVRCDFNARDPTGACERCHRAARECVFTDNVRRRRKPADERIAELEKTVARMAARMAARWGEERGGEDEGEEAPRKRSRVVLQPTSVRTPVQRPPQMQTQSTALAGRPDVIETEMLSLEHADQIFKRYTNEQMGVLPIVVFPPGMSTTSIRREKPVLFLSVLVAACGNSALRTQLHVEMMHVFATHVLHHGTKSLELVQALTLASLWPNPVEELQSFKLNSLVHLAAAMAADAGLMQRARDTSNIADALERAGVKVPVLHTLQQTDAGTPAAMRALLGVYLVGFNTALLYRRPTILRFTTYMQHCLTTLAASADPHDVHLAAWTAATVAAEDFLATWQPAPRLPGLGIHTPAGRAALATYTATLPPPHSPPSSPTLQLWRAILTMHVHETAINADILGASELRPPFFESYILAPATVASPPDKRALRDALAATHAVLDAFAALAAPTMLALPMFCFANIGSALALLLKLHFVVTASRAGGQAGAGQAGAGQAGAGQAGADMDMDVAVSRYVATTKAALTPYKTSIRPAARILAAVTRLTDWLETSGGKVAEVLRTLDRGSAAEETGVPMAGGGGAGGGGGGGAGGGGGGAAGGGGGGGEGGGTAGSGVNAGGMEFFMDDAGGWGFLDFMNPGAGGWGFLDAPGMAVGGVPEWPGGEGMGEGGGGAGFQAW
ncbi:hypothetical protein EDC01DRAFT_731800 [Geopyxis carbonaria]|nr:hypothetical protein EDC01DRAFT_731800 [Geopyxis carbonaria]